LRSGLKKLISFRKHVFITLNITKETKLKDLLDADPNLKQYLFTISDKFRALDTPLARIMLPKATVEKMSERTGVALDEIISKLKQYFQK